MTSELKKLLDKVKETADFENVNFSDLNATNRLGNNALHCVAVWNDCNAAKLLINSGIRISQRGDLGNTPLHEACATGNLEMVELLVENGADIFVLNEGSPPFTIARLNGHNHLCDYLAKKMNEFQDMDKEIWIKKQITYLENEIERLKAKRID